MEFYKSANVRCHLQRIFLCVLIICLLLKCLASSVCIAIECRCHIVFVFGVFFFVLHICCAPFFSFRFCNSFDLRRLLLFIWRWLHRFAFLHSHSMQRMPYLNVKCSALLRISSENQCDMTWQPIDKQANFCHAIDAFCLHFDFVLHRFAVPLR